MTSKVTSKRPASDHKQEHKKNPPDFFSLKKRYKNPDLIDDAFRAIATTRKSGKVADSVLIAQLQKWDRYPVEQVEAGIRVYLEKDYATEGKCEKYLYGIIRKSRSQPKRRNDHQPKYVTEKDLYPDDWPDTT